MGRNRSRANGDGSFYQTKSGLWRGVAYVHTPAGGTKRKYVSSVDRDEAHRKWLDLVRKSRSGQPVNVGPQRLDDYLAYWLAEVVKPWRRHNTYAMYETFVRLYLVPPLGSKRLDRLKVSDVRSFLRKLRDDGASPRKVQAARAVLRAALSNAVTEELVDRNVATMLTVPRPPKRRIHPWEPEEARAFLSAAEGRVLYPAYVVQLCLGLRRGEVLGLGWDDVDLDRGEAHIRWQIQRVGGQLVRVPVKTADSEGVIPLPPFVVKALAARQTVQQAERERSGARWSDPHGWRLILTTPAGGPIDPRNFNRSFHAVARAAGVRSIRVHDTRHTCASLLRSLGVDLSVIKEILRHSQISITADVYVHVTTKQQREAVGLISDVLDPPDRAA
jgi:integrase